MILHDFFEAAAAFDEHVGSMTGRSWRPRSRPSQRYVTGGSTATPRTTATKPRPSTTCG